MILIIGLGNPGKKFRNTRHNMGFLILNQFKKGKNFSRWQKKNKFKARISEGRITGKKIMLAKPQTFINSSGQSVKILTTHYKLKTINLFVVHDDLNIPLGKMKISKEKGAAGHKGVQSIIDELGTKDFVRFRIGINHETYNIKHKTKEKFVLEKFTKKEQEILRQIKKRACKALETVIGQGIEKAMTEFNSPRKD